VTDHRATDHRATGPDAVSERDDAGPKAGVVQNCNR